jgi:glycosyltransferase involved in cell wall biosynthesis
MACPRILAVSHESLLYGAPRSLTMICAHLAGEGRARVRMLTFGPGDMVAHARGEGLEIDVLDACDRIPDPARPALAFRAEQAWLRVQRRLCALRVFGHLLAEMRRADLVYVNTVLRAAPIWASRLMRRPLVIHVREAENYLKPGTAWRRWRLRRLLGCAGRVICVSEAVRRLVLAVPGTGLAPERVVTIHNGIDAARFAPDAAARAAFRAAHGIPGEAPVACFVGNMRPRKGLDLFLRAAAALRAEMPEAHFVVAGGTGAEIAEARRAFVPDTLAPAMHFLGFIDDVRPVLWGADVFAMLSRVEPFARVNLEASAAGCAVLATAVDGNVEIFEDGVNARVIAPDDLPAAIAGLRRLLGDGALRARLAAAARARVAERFTLPACHDRVAEILTAEARR